MSTADDIRSFTHKAYIEPARQRGVTEVTIRAGDVHQRMGLQNKLPAVCSALGTNKFERECHVRRTAVEGPLNGSNCELTFELL